MKPKVLLAGGTGYIGRYLSRVIEHDAQLFALSKYFFFSSRRRHTR